MIRNRRQTPEIRTQMLYVQLLDMFAEVESLLRSGREIQRNALQLRDAAPANGTQRRVATRRIHEHVRQMRKECQEVCEVVQALEDRTAAFARGGAQPQAPETRRGRRGGSWGAS
jgi:hypothetical protein